MLIFNCTKAAQDFFTVTRSGKKQTIVEAPPTKDMSEDAQHLNYEDGSPAKPQQWLLHAVSIKRKHCLVAMEVDTRFSIIVMSVAKADVDDFLQYFYSFLSAQMSAYGETYGIWPASESDVIVKSCFAHTQEVHFFKRSERSVQTQMNEVVRWLREDVDEYPDLLTNNVMIADYIEHTNDTLRKSRAFPEKDYIIPVEEMFIYWQREYQGANPEQLEATREMLVDIRRSDRMQKLRGVGDFSPPEIRDDLPSLPDGSNLTMPGDGILTSSEMDFLDAMLLKYKTDVSLKNLSSLHGFLTAIVSGPNMLLPSIWLPEIWGEEDEQQPLWKNPEELEQFMNAVIRMMNGIAGTLIIHPQDYAAMFTSDENHIDVRDWCFGYMGGYGLDQEAWDEMPGDLLRHLELLDEVGFTAAGAYDDVSPSDSRILGTKITGIAQDFHAYWLKQRSPQQRPDNVVELRPQHPVTSEKVGRNEPCPCGSGKKFKQCCLH